MWLSADWLVAVPSFAVSVLLFIVPGLIVRFVGWNVRAIAPYFLAPAISTAIVAVAANVAPVLGLPWSPLPVVLVTVLAAGVGFGLRRWVGRETVDRPHPRRIVAAVGGFLLAGAILTAQLAYVFVGPENISQTFDSIVHLNSIRFALDAGDASDRFLDGEVEEIVRSDQPVRLAELIPGATLVLMPGVGHFAMFDKPDEFNRIVLEYLASPAAEATPAP